MALKIAVLKNSLKTSKSPYVVRSDSSEVVEYDQFVELMAGGRTSLSQIEIGSHVALQGGAAEATRRGKAGTLLKLLLHRRSASRSGRRSNVLTHILRIGLSWRRYLSLG